MLIATRKLDPNPRQTALFRSVGFTLSTLGYTVSRRFHDVLVPLELEPSEFAVLRAVGVAEGQSQQALAEHLHISPSHMVSIIDELERRKLVERKPQSSDRRVRTLHLTSTGRKKVKARFLRHGATGSSSGPLCSWPPAITPGECAAYSIEK